jgi:putative NADPH-quinone reductase
LRRNRGGRWNSDCASNTETQREKDVFGDPLETIWKNCIFDLCGVTNFHRRMFNVIVSSTDKQRKKWLDSVTKDINKLFPQIR